MRPFGPKSGEHPSVGDLCPICGEAFEAGDFTTLVAMAPAGPEDQANMEAGRAYNAVAREVHWRHAVESPYHRRNCLCSDDAISDECERFVEGWMRLEIRESGEEGQDGSN